MLVDSPRLTDRDREEWDRMERYDKALSTSRRMARLVEAAVAEIQLFTGTREGSVACSWGKDSLVTTHLAFSAGCDWPVVFLKKDRYYNPDCLLVRDAWLARFPQTKYFEVHSPVNTANVRWLAPVGEHPSLASRKARESVAEKFGAARLSGIRSEESPDRALSAAVHGTHTDVSCRPILRWGLLDVFAYLALHDLPVHPAYAMTTKTPRERDQIRVAPIGGHIGGLSRKQWEDAYYGDICGT